MLIPPFQRNVGANRALHPDCLWIRLVRGGAGLAMLAALGQEIYDATQPGNSVYIPQLLSQFTFQSNLVFGLVLLVSAARPRARLPQWWDHLFGALAFYLVMTGIIYVVLVAPPDEPWWTLDMYWPWMVTHRIAPLVAGLDWLFVTRTVRGPWWRPLVWLCYPVAFLIFSWVRGGVTSGHRTPGGYFRRRGEPEIIQAGEGPKRPGRPRAVPHRGIPGGLTCIL